MASLIHIKNPYNIIAYDDELLLLDIDALPSPLNPGHLIPR
jgi:hypothetical protein